LSQLRASPTKLGDTSLPDSDVRHVNELEVDMTRKRLFIGSAAALALAAAVAYGSFAAAQPYGGGWGMMGGGHGPGMMQGWGSGGGYGPGMMQGWGSGGGYGPGMMQGYGRSSTRGYGPQNCPWFQGTAGSGGDQQGTLNLSTDDVKARFERWIDVQGNPRLKLGGIREKDADTVEVDIVTKDNSLVQQFLVNRHSGAFRPSGS
jgi:hypothetical protein